MREYIASSPRRGQLVKLYDQVYRGEIVHEEERSQAQNQLKLIGLLQVEDGSPPRKLFVRNKVYREAFNQDWIDKNLTPPNKLSGYWLYGLGILVVLIILGGIFAITRGFYQYTSTPTAVTQIPPSALMLLSNFCDDQIGTFYQGDIVYLEWSWNGRLLNNEYLEVRVGARDAGDFQYRQSINIEPWRYGVPIQELVALYPNAKSFEWRIVHMAANQQTEKAVSVLGCFNFE